MKKLGYLIFIVITIITLVSCTPKIDLVKEKKDIESVAKDLIIDDFKPEFADMETKLIPESVKIHEIMDLDDYVYMLYSYNYKVVDVKNESNTENEDFMKSKDYYLMQLRVIQKDNSSPLGYKLMGGGGGGGTVQDSPFTASGSGNKVYGLINNNKVAKIAAEYKDGRVITQNVENKDYFFIYRYDKEDVSFPSFKAYDKNGVLVE
ncbi:hypothetical protein [Sporosalibacterium faouarense]|uniref:hypothetical protein n=1 Tax=Sporosalibacterium faouarense TaxID=516123 RepID=UPI00141D154D|nr:hypothetical protein [Sporosalibacterium faouarense]MTI47682.1 hypothetical protein [Bacillota bacterium]